MNFSEIIPFHEVYLQPLSASRIVLVPQNKWDASPIKKAIDVVASGSNPRNAAAMLSVPESKLKEKLNPSYLSEELSSEKIKALKTTLPPTFKKELVKQLQEFKKAGRKFTRNDFLKMCHQLKSK